MKFDLSKYTPSAEHVERIVIAIIILFIGLLIIHLLAFVVKKFLPNKWSKQRKMVVNRFIQYSGYVFLFFVLISELNLSDKLTTLFGAAGIIGIIIGFASQTSIGNIISGFFLVSEKSFEIGDLVRIGDKLGTVYSIDLLSIKIKTLDNLLVRIPNQTVISTELTNVTRFPIRRMDIDVSVAYKEDLGKVTVLLEKIARDNSLCLDEPEPLIIFKTFGASGIDILFGVWFEKNNFKAVKNSVFQDIMRVFREEGIEIPFPHISLYTGEVTKPFPVSTKKVD